MRATPNLWLYIVIALLFAGVGSPADAQRKPPYWVSVDEPEARMRTGPSRDYPTLWMYRRENLPVKVLTRYKNWRKVEDPDGTQGWMHVRLLTTTRTGLIIGSISEMREKPDPQSRVNWRLEPGVVGKLSECANGWCLFDVNGRTGYVLAERIWGSGEL